MSGLGSYFGRGGGDGGRECGGGGGGGIDDARAGSAGSGVILRGAPCSRAASSARSAPICSYSARTCCSNTAIRCSSAIAPPGVKLLERLRRRAAARRNCELV